MKNTLKKIKDIENNIKNLTKEMYILFESILELTPEDNKKLVIEKLKSGILYKEIATRLYSLVLLFTEFIIIESKLNGKGSKKSSFRKSINEVINKSKLFKDIFT